MATPTYIGSLRSTLGLSPDADEYWKVLDENEEENLYLVHYVTEKIASLQTSDIDTLTQSRILGLRGVIVYLSKNADGSYAEIGNIVTRGFSYTPTCTMSELFDEKAQSLELVDNNGGKHTLNFAKDSQLRFTTAFDGTVLRISKWNGKILTTTSKRLNISRSFWGSSNYFPQIYADLKGPNPEDLFDKTKAFSNISFLFMLVHPDLAIGSRVNVGKGYIAYLGYRYNNVKLNDQELKFNDDYELQPNLSETIRFATTTTINTDGKPCAPYRPPTTDKDLGYILKPTSMTAKDLNIANLIMNVGDSSYSLEDMQQIDPRLTQGESIIMTYTDQFGYGRMIRISPIAHNWRLAVMGGIPNRYNRFVIYWSYALRQPLDNLYPNATYPNGTALSTVFNGSPEKVYSYDQLFPILATPTKEELERFQKDVATSTPFVLPCTMPDYFTNAFTKDAPPDVLMRNIAACFILAVPPNHVVETIGFYPKFLAQREFMINELVNNFQKYKALYNNNKDSSKWGLVDREIYKAAGEKLSFLTFPKTAEGKETPQPFSKKEKGGVYVLNLAGKRIVDVYSQAIKYADEAERTNRWPKDDKGMPLPRLTVLKNNLVILLNKERGMSLYSMLIAVAKSKGVKVEENA
jgi:hypothetical protein